MTKQPNELTPQELAYAAGYKRGLAEARAELKAMAHRIADKIADLQGDYATLEEEHRRLQIAFLVEFHQQTGNRLDLLLN